MNPAIPTRWSIWMALLAPAWLCAQAPAPETPTAAVSAAETAPSMAQRPAGEAAAPAPKTDAVFRFEREKDSWILIDVNVRVFLDGKQVCTLTNGGNCEVQASPGARRIKIDQRFTTGEFSREFNAQAGKRYTLGVTRKESKLWLEAFSPIVGGVTYFLGNRSGLDSDNSDWTAKVIAEE